MGHRRVTQGGDVTYKKIQTSQIMGSIQLGVQHAIGGLASKPERDLLMQVRGECMQCCCRCNAVSFYVEWSPIGSLERG